MPLPGMQPLALPEQYSRRKLDGVCAMTRTPSARPYHPLSTFSGVIISVAAYHLLNIRQPNWVSHVWHGLPVQACGCVKRGVGLSACRKVEESAGAETEAERVLQSALLAARTAVARLHGEAAEVPTATLHQVRPLSSPFVVVLVLSSSQCPL